MKTTRFFKSLVILLLTANLAKAQVDVKWSDYSSTMTVTYGTNGSIIRQNSGGTGVLGNAKASNVLPCCVQKGYCEARFVDMTGIPDIPPYFKEWVFGLDAAGDATNVDYAIVLQRSFGGGGYTLYVVEDHTYGYAPTTVPTSTVHVNKSITYNANDIFKIERSGSNIVFYHNSTVLYTLTSQPCNDLTVVGYLWTDGTQIADAKCSFMSACREDSWTGAGSGTVRPVYLNDNVYVPSKLGVGTGTSAPGTALDVNGVTQIRPGGYLRVGAYTNTDRYGYLSSGGQGGNTGLKLETTDGTNQAGATRVTITSDGNVQIGPGIPSHLLQLTWDDAAKPFTGTWTILSDKRLKTGIEPYKEGLSLLKKINPVWFSYTGSYGMPADKKAVGVIAQEIAEIAPHMVSESKLTDPETKESGTFLSYNPNALLYITVNAIKEQQQIIEENKTEIASLKEQLAVLAAQVSGCCSASANNTSATGGTGNISNVMLDQNIPNPFEDVTVIGYYLPENVGNASLSIYDLNGRLLKTYPISQKGKGSVSVKAGELAAGMYLYSLIADGKEAITKRMVIGK